MPDIDVNGITVHYRDEGDGPALVLVHGHPFDHTLWDPQVEQFAAAGWRVIAPDLRGYGASTVVPGTIPLALFARDLATLMDALDIPEFVLGGLSMGGQIVLACHRLFPNRIRGLVLADTSAGPDSTVGRHARRALAYRLEADGMLAYGEFLPKMVSSATRADRPDVVDHVLAMMLRTPPQGAAAALRGRAERPDYTPDLAHVGVPTLVIVGSEDEYTPVAEAELLCAGIPGATMVIIDGAGHLPNLERPAEFNQALGGFLTGLRSRVPVGRSSTRPGRTG